jgi:hypothetical protein
MNKRNKEGGGSSTPATSLCTQGRNSLQAKERIGDSSYRVTVDIGVSVTIVRPVVTAGLPKRDPSTNCALQTASGKTLPILKEALVTLTLGRHRLTTGVSITSITDDFILGLDVMHNHDPSVDLGCHVYDWAMRKFYCDAPGRDHLQPPICRATAK